ncbi:hypothetical protein OS493_006931 [Desmophyllum pertusum]|uniref:RING-type domain-containing protein n=1 Tax=Desmophyllum pertusum TaxID=174260 RepID=A0A9W9ZSH2_9CNID|nr:hypothetical protein OS493_006931 [Desmophyllum pertusum]
MSAIPVGCSCIFHQFCLEEWLKTSDDGSIKCPVCNTVFCEMDSSIFASELSDNSNQDVIPGPLNVASPSVESEILRVDVDLVSVCCVIRYANKIMLAIGMGRGLG